MKAKASHDLSATTEERKNIFLRLNQMNLDRLKKIEWIWREVGIKKGMRGLDAACGSGCWMREISKLFENELDLVGVDSADDFVEWAIAENQKLKFENIEIINSDIHHLPPLGTFDFIHISDYLAGVKNPEKVIIKLSRRLKPGGLLVIEDIDLANWSITPLDARWTSLIEQIQNNDKAHFARELVLSVESCGFEMIMAFAFSTGRKFDSVQTFPTLHTFLPEVEHVNVLKLISELASPNRYAFIGRVVIVGRKSEIT